MDRVFAGGVISTLKRTGIPLGLRPETVYEESSEIELSPGQIVLLVTDGFEEAVNGRDELMGAERMLQVVGANRDKPAGEIVQALYDTTREFTGDLPPGDDLTAIVIKVK